MAYQWIGENWGRSMIIDAIKAGYTVEVSYERGYGEPDYVGTEPLKAWEAVTAVDECHVFLRKAGEKTQWAFIVLDYGQDGSEVISDYASSGWLDQWWKAKVEADRAA